MNSPPSIRRVGIGVLAVGNVTIGIVFRVGLGMKSVAGGVDSDKAQPAMDGVEQRLLAGRRHGRIPVRAGRGQISGRKEKHRRIFLEVGGIEDPAVFGGGDFEAMLLAESPDCLFQDAGVSGRDLDHIVFKAGRLGEDEHGFFPCGEQGVRQGKSGASDGAGLEELTAADIVIHLIAFPRWFGVA